MSLQFLLVKNKFESSQSSIHLGAFLCLELFILFCIENKTPKKDILFCMENKKEKSFVLFRIKIII